MPPHDRIRDFLSAEEHRALLDWTLGKADRFLRSTFGPGTYDPAVRRSLHLPGVGPHEQVLTRRLTERLAGIFEATGTKPFDPGEPEFQLVAHGDGDHYKLHRDVPLGSARAAERPDPRGDRAISAVYYYHREPKAFTGGALRLHRFDSRDAPGDYVDLEPEQNSLLVFPAWAPHEVRPVSLPSGRFEDRRFSINIWLRRPLFTAPRA